MEITFIGSLAARVSRCKRIRKQKWSYILGQRDVDEVIWEQGLGILVW
jgi:hypothetical protein